MDEGLKKKIERARELLATSKHISVATVNEDGSPHNSVLRFFYDSQLKNIYWGSHPDSIHSLNITRTGKVFAVLYDRIESGGLFIKAENVYAVQGEEIKEALAIHNRFRAKVGSQPLDLSYYTGNSPQRMWKAEITNFWVNYADRDKDGHVKKDGRQEIFARDLL